MYRLGPRLKKINHLSVLARENFLMVKDYFSRGMVKDFNASNAFSGSKRAAYVAHRDVKRTDSERAAEDNIKTAALNGVCSR